MKPETEAPKGCGCIAGPANASTWLGLALLGLVLGARRRR
ncbi:MAG: MYXO-CTERM sorting domain-containing protein [Archangium sp.]|nr:MYXO-CTERM sorting domain-containing protein [Archangium sp.]